jgi:hypothetical protein
MFFFIDQDNQIVGYCNDESVGTPSGFTLVEGPNTSRDDLYYDGTAIQFKPDRPSDTTYWDNTTNTWQEPPPPPPPPVLPNWGNLADRLVADIDILAILATNPLFPALVGRLQTLRNGGAMGDPEPLIALWNHQSYSFTEAQLDTLSAMAEDEHIPLAITAEGMLAATS